MRRFSDDDGGQLILTACISITAALVLIATHEYSTLGTGEKSINRENINSYYYYNSIRERYINISNDPAYSDLNKSKNITVFEKEMKDFAILHGYSVNFVCSGENRKIIFMDKGIRIEEELGERGLCH